MYKLKSNSKSNTFLINQLYAIGAVKTGNFILKCGETTDIYFDMRKVISYPTIFKGIVEKLYNLLCENEWGECVVAGVPTAGIPFATGISLEYGIPAILVRDKPKGYGSDANSPIHGETFGKSVILIEDTITTGTSVSETIKLLADQSINVSAVLSIIDRGGLANVEIDKKMALFTSNEILNARCKESCKIIYELAVKKSSNIIVAVDLPTANEALALIEKIGAFVLGIKLHSDLYQNDNSTDFINNVLRLKWQHSLFVIEDCKIADIAKIAVRKASVISKWADAITVYAISGLEMLESINEGVPDLGMLVIHSLSTNTTNDLLTDKYREIVKESAKLQNVIGFITQEPVVPGMLNFAPGVNLQPGKNYNTPETMINRGIDILIIGRAVYEADSFLRKS